MSGEDEPQISPLGEPPPRVSDTTVPAIMGVIAVGGAACAVGSAWSAAEAQEILARGQRAIELALGGVGVSDLTRFCLTLCVEASNPDVCLLAIPTLAIVIGAAGYWAYLEGRQV